MTKPVTPSTIVPPMQPAREVTLFMPPEGANTISCLGNGWMQFTFADKVFLYRIVKTGSRLSQVLTQVV